MAAVADHHGWLETAPRQHNQSKSHSANVMIEISCKFFIIGSPRPQHPPGSATCAEGELVKKLALGFVATMLALMGSACSSPKAAPGPIPGISDATSIAAQRQTACAIVEGGRVECWGSGYKGALGNGSTESVELPVQVGGISGATAISAAGVGFCVVVAAGAVKCWGDYDPNTDVDHALSPTPIAVPGISGAIAIDDHCAVISGGTVDCWASGSSTVTTLPGVSAAVAFSNGSTEDCYLNTSGAVSCAFWSDAETATNWPTVVPAGASQATASCAILAGAIQCWGYNDVGQLGNGTNTTSPTPVSVAGINDAVAVSSAFSSSCAIVGGGHAACWGSGYGNGGLGGANSDESSVTPSQIPGISNAIAIADGGRGTVSCWGDYSIPRS